MEATEAQRGAGCLLQMKLQRTRSRVWEFRPFSSGFGEMCMQQGEHIRAPGLTQQKTRECQGDLQSLSRLRDHTPMNPVERTTPFKALTSSSILCARVEIPTSAALAMLSFSITGSRLWITSATTSNTGHCGPPPIKASIRIKGPADQPLERLDIVPDPIVFARRSHSVSVSSTSENARRAEQRARSGRSPCLVPEIQSILQAEHAAPTCEWRQPGLDNTSVPAGRRSHQTVDQTSFPQGRLREISHLSSHVNAPARWPTQRPFARRLHPLLHR